MKVVVIFESDNQAETTVEVQVKCSKEELSLALPDEPNGYPIIAFVWDADHENVRGLLEVF